ncbi:MAG: MBL fold metallo-hydrolase [Verrucomicrobia bacterium]|nr:MBL fold metallo-hydrolase [Verrucomicrobiota bacterium]
MNRFLRSFVVLAILNGVVFGADASSAARDRVHALRITVLSTMLADGEGLGEWGFAALVEADGHRILFDTGAHTDVVLKNARALKVDLTTVPDVILSHWHSDHVGGFMTLRESVRAKAPGALGRTHVGEGIFYPRTAAAPPVEINPMLRLRPDYEKTGGVFVTHAKPAQLYPGVWLTGPVPRRHPERNWSGHGKVTTPAGVLEDNVPDDMSLVFDTPQGLIVLTGCGHAGVINITEHAREFIRPAPIHALIGGVHLFNASEETLAWTAGKLRGFGVDHLIGAHCTGIETVFRLRRDLALDRARAVVGSVGASFELGKGINPGMIAK